MSIYIRGQKNNKKTHRYTSKRGEYTFKLCLNSVSMCLDIVYAREHAIFMRTTTGCTQKVTFQHQNNAS